MANEKNTENQSAFKELVLPVIVLVAICLICSALLAVLNDITAPIIEENTQAETLAAYVSVLPEGTTTDSMTAIDGLTTANVVKTTVFIADMNDFPKVNEVYKKYFCEPFPARSCVAVKELPLNGLVEIEAIVVL